MDYISSSAQDNKNKLSIMKSSVDISASKLDLTQPATSFDTTSKYQKFFSRDRLAGARSTQMINKDIAESEFGGTQKTGLSSRKRISTDFAL